MPEIYCENCGNITQPSDLYCRECGYSMKKLSGWQAFRTGIMIGVIPMGLACIFFSLMLGLWYGIIASIASNTPMGILGGSIGALIGKGWKDTKRATQIGAILGTVIGIGAGFLLARLGVRIEVPQ